MAKDANHTTHGGGIRDYVVVALILGVITYVEFAIVEYDYAWLSSGAVLWILMVLSVVKFVMVIMFFMHLKDDDATYSGFFSVGMLMALGTFVAFAFLMTAPSSINFFRANVPPGSDGPTEHAEEAHELDDATAALIESDGYSRSQAELMDTGRPKDQALQVEPPAAAEAEFSLSDAPAADAPADAPAADAPADAAAAGEAGALAAEGEPAGEEVAAGGWDQELGEQVYGANCASCHQANGQGIPGAFPPLAGHAAEVAGVEGGREHLMNAVLFGLQGAIEVQGQTYNGVMPAWSHLNDDQIAAVVNHVIFLDGGDIEPVAPGEVADRRGLGLSAQDVHANREELALP